MENENECTHLVTLGTGSGRLVCLGCGASLDTLVGGDKQDKKPKSDRADRMDRHG